MQPQQKVSPFAKFRQLDRENSLPKWVLIALSVIDEFDKVKIGAKHSIDRLSIR